MKKEFLECGKIVTTHGIKGEVKVEPWCDSVDFLMDFDTLYLDGGKTPVQVRVRPANAMAIVKMEGVDTIEEAVRYRGKVLYIRRDDVELEDRDYFIQELLGMDVVDADDGHRYGRLTEVFQTGANDVYQITDDAGREVLVPAIPQVIITTDLDANVMTIRPLEGLFDDEN